MCIVVVPMIAHHLFYQIFYHQIFYIETWQYENYPFDDNQTEIEFTRLNRIYLYFSLQGKRVNRLQFDAWKWRQKSY